MPSAYLAKYMHFLIITHYITSSDASHLRMHHTLAHPLLEIWEYSKILWSPIFLWRFPATNIAVHTYVLHIDLRFTNIMWKLSCGSLCLSFSYSVLEKNYTIAYKWYSKKHMNVNCINIIKYCRTYAKRPHAVLMPS